MVVRAGILVAVLVILTGCSGGMDTAAEGPTVGHAAVEPATGQDGQTQEAADPDDTTGGGYGAPGEGSGDEANAQDGDDAGPVSEPLPESTSRTGERIIKEGTVALEVEQGMFDRAFIAVISAARRFGGDVVGSSTRTGDDGETFGSVTVRVPVGSFEDLLVGVGDIGVIRNRDVDATDVTAEYTDLESRLRHLRAQERFYLGLLERAESVRDAIEVQQQLDGIQQQIERIQGRLNLLEDRTSFSTLTVELFEPGAGGALLADTDPGARPTLARYWDTARDAFVNVVGAMLVAGLFAVPLLVAFAALLLLWRVLRKPAAPRRDEVVKRESEGMTPDNAVSR